MKRNKKVIFTSHCILNQNAVVKPLARAKGGFNNIILTLIKNDIGIHQIQCPEFMHLGLNRKPMTKEEYNTDEFIALCERIADDTISSLKEYLENNYQVMGILGINQSPTCSIKGEKGHLMDIIIKKIEAHNLDIPLIDLPTDHHEGDTKFIEQLEDFIKKPTH